MSTNPLACIVLAAGQGSRMKSDKHKVLHELAGLPMINWLINTLETLNPEKIIVVTPPGADELEAAVNPHETAIQKQARGTADAVKAALPVLEGFEGDVLITLGDTPLVQAQSLTDLIATRAGAGLTVLATIMEDPTGYGRVVMDEEGLVQKIVEEKDASEEEKQIQIVNTGIFCVDGKHLATWLEQIDNDNAQGEYYITDLPEIAARDGKVTTVCATLDANEVQGCNTRTDLSALETTLQNRLRYELMLSGVTMIDPTTVYLHHDTVIAPDVVIEPSVYFGPGVSVDSGVRLKAFSHLEGSRISRNATVGPFARLRPGTLIGEEARIGNFVEIKKSTIGDKSKISHLAYVGDTEMGEDVNFSAGAITVNYDGFEKHKTVIGKNVMVGSNANLVAPLSIDDGAFIAAGSTITEDVPADALSIARNTSSVREGWAKEYRKRKAEIVKKLKEKKKA